MIDFKNAGFFKLKQIDYAEVGDMIQPILIEGERIASAYKGLRDCVVFTDKRIIAVNVQGLTGTKKDFTSLPYSKVQAYSVETAGIAEWVPDCELDLFFSGLGQVRFEFKSNCNIKEICRLISEYVL